MVCFTLRYLTPFLYGTSIFPTLYLKPQNWAAVKRATLCDDMCFRFWVWGFVLFYLLTCLSFPDLNAPDSPIYFKSERTVE